MKLLQSILLFNDAYLNSRIDVCYVILGKFLIFALFLEYEFIRLIYSIVDIDLDYTTSD